MQTIEEYKAYTKQLEGEVGKWHHAYDALVIERNALVRKILETEKSVEVKDHANGYECVMILRSSYKAFSSEIEELRKHEVEWDMAGVQMKVNISCDYCRRSKKCTMYMITLTSFTDRSNSCTKVICENCAERLGVTLDEILDKRDVDDALHEIENGILGDEK